MNIEAHSRWALTPCKQMGCITVDLAKISGPVPGIFVMSHRWGYPPVGVLVVPPGASFDAVTSKWHCGHVHKNTGCLKIERR